MAEGAEVRGDWEAEGGSVRAAIGPKLGGVHEIVWGRWKQARILTAALQCQVLDKRVVCQVEGTLCRPDCFRSLSSLG